jgi:hypothetical protein
VAIAALVSLGLAGCETGTSLLGDSGSPSATVAEAPAGQPAPAAHKSRLTVAPVIGAPDAVAKQLHGQLAQALEKQGVAVTKSAADKADFTLRGYVVSAREKTATKVSYIWDVTDPAGKRVNRVTGEEVVANGGSGRDPWAAVTPQITQTIADKTATSMSTWLSSQTGAAVAGGAASNAVATAPANNVGAPSAVGAGAGGAPVQTAALETPAAAPAASGPTTGSIAGPVTAIVPTVAGAPGDGSTSLAQALQRELSRNGVALTETPTNAAYKVEGKVSVGPGKDGKQPISIDWLVKDPSGRKLGTVSQKNEIPQGSLDGSWGKTADAAAAAAAQGIIKLLPQSSTH